ncbi:MAG: hypothetical protein SFY81_10385 [Verrucomicrobiota bacterium]|nr:hypothetical protein [Verrucomicrobiota bacterium]
MIDLPALLATGLRSYYYQHPTIEIEQTCSSELLLKGVKTNASLGLLDIDKPRMTLSLSESLKALYPHLKLVFFGHTQPSHRLGKQPFLLKSATFSEITEVLMKSSKDSSGYGSRTEISSQVDRSQQLSFDDLQMISLLAEGADPDQVCAALGWSRSKLLRRKGIVMARLQLRSPADVARYAWRQGLFNIMKDEHSANNLTA